MAVAEKVSGCRNLLGCTSYPKLPQNPVATFVEKLKLKQNLFMYSYFRDSISIEFPLLLFKNKMKIHVIHWLFRHFTVTSFHLSAHRLQNDPSRSNSFENEQKTTRRSVESTSRFGSPPLSSPRNWTCPKQYMSKSATTLPPEQSFCQVAAKELSRLHDLRVLVLALNRRCSSANTTFYHHHQ